MLLGNQQPPEGIGRKQRFRFQFPSGVPLRKRDVGQDVGGPIDNDFKFVDYNGCVDAYRRLLPGDLDEQPNDDLLAQADDEGPPLAGEISLQSLDPPEEVRLPLGNNIGAGRGWL